MKKNQNQLPQEFLIFLKAVIKAQERVDQQRAALFHRSAQQIWGSLKLSTSKNGRQAQILSLKQLLVGANMSGSRSISKEQESFLQAYFCFQQNNESCHQSAATTKKQFIDLVSRPINNILIQNESTSTCTKPMADSQFQKMNVIQCIKSLIKSVVLGHTQIQEHLSACKRHLPFIQQYFHRNYQVNKLSQQALKQFVYESGIYSRVNFNYLKRFIFGMKKSKQAQQDESIEWNKLFDVRKQQKHQYEQKQQKKQISTSSPAKQGFGTIKNRSPKYLQNYIKNTNADRITIPQLSEEYQVSENCIQLGTATNKRNVQLTCNNQVQSRNRNHFQNDKNNYVQNMTEIDQVQNMLNQTKMKYLLGREQLRMEYEGVTAQAEFESKMDKMKNGGKEVEAEREKERKMERIDECAVNTRGSAHNHYDDDINAIVSRNENQQHLQRQQPQRQQSRQQRQGLQSPNRSIGRIKKVQKVSIHDSHNPYKQQGTNLMQRVVNNNQQDLKFQNQSRLEQQCNKQNFKSNNNEYRQDHDLQVTEQQGVNRKQPTDTPADQYYRNKNNNNHKQHEQNSQYSVYQAVLQEIKNSEHSYRQLLQERQKFMEYRQLKKKYATKGKGKSMGKGVGKEWRNALNGQRNQVKMRGSNLGRGDEFVDVAYNISKKADANDRIGRKAERGEKNSYNDYDNYQRQKQIRATTMKPVGNISRYSSPIAMNIQPHQSSSNHNTTTNNNEHNLDKSNYKYYIPSNYSSYITPSPQFSSQPSLQTHIQPHQQSQSFSTLTPSPSHLLQNSYSQSIIPRRSVMNSLIAADEGIYSQYSYDKPHNSSLSSSRLSSKKRHQIVQRATSEAKLRIQEIENRALNKLSKLDEDVISFQLSARQRQEARSTINSINNGNGIYNSNKNGEGRSTFPHELDREASQAHQRTGKIKKGCMVKQNWSRINDLFNKRPVDLGQSPFRYTTSDFFRARMY